MGLRTALPIVSLALVTGLAAAAAGTGKGRSKIERLSFQKEVAPLLKKYCSNCHGPKAQTAGVDVTQYRDEAAVVQARMVWEKISENVQSGHMPPKGALQPTDKERTTIASWIDAKLSQVDCDLRDPGRVTLRRLNRAEYNNTIRDLVGVAFKPAEDFPSDDVGYGFDNIGDVLSLSPLLMEKYLNAAEQIIDKAVVAPESGTQVDHVEVENLPGGGDLYENNYLMLGRTGDSVQRRFNQGKEGDYLVRIRAFGQLWGPEPPKMELRVDDQVVQVFDVTAEEDAPKVYIAKIHASEGRHLVKATYLNNYNTANDPDPKKRGDRNLIVDYLELVGPLVPRLAGLPESHRRIFTVQPEEGKEREAARKILAQFAERAFRRPVTEEEVERLVRIYDGAAKEGGSFEFAMQPALQAVLVSPNFLFRVELDPAKGEEKKDEGGAIRSSSFDLRPLNSWELASRLSYFLWSSMPDEELFRLARTGELEKPEVLREQARRMLLDPKASALAENFGDQWLTLRNLKTMAPDPQRFPTFNEELRTAMLRETELFFENIMREDRSLLELFDAKYTFLNERLAKHYGIDWVKGDHFRKVVLKGDQRGGVFTQASILTVTSNPNRTNPVKRGKWILEQILGTPPPPPPPDVPKLAEEGEGKPLTGTLRQRMEQHRADPGCAVCHARLDPLGFALENYDAVGAWREKDGGEAIDASGKLPGGESFKGPDDFKKIILKKKEQIVRNLSGQMLTYALGRGLDHTDQCAVNEIAETAAKHRYRFSTLVMAVVESEPFRKRKIEASAP